MSALILEYDDAGTPVYDETALCLCGHELLEHAQGHPSPCQHEGGCEDKCLRFRWAEDPEYLEGLAP